LSPEVIQYAVWLYHRFNLSHRDIEDLLRELIPDTIHDIIANSEKVPLRLGNAPQHYRS